MAIFTVDRIVEYPRFDLSNVEEEVDKEELVVVEVGEEEEKVVVEVGEEEEEALRWDSAGRDEAGFPK